ncbi:DgyrCDS14451 [Dimorphilus gyrociliatus]|uniref:DgyrCDS14451 n=1 Tax=Dimorphilus gyrociliatus TaxID=2664684 RepID=A0A7I8WDP4_9ANNE|nr:DgyrCDS14451 [Dimorphilus gyrociliatus]
MKTVLKKTFTILTVTIVTVFCDTKQFEDELVNLLNNKLGLSAYQNYLDKETNVLYKKRLLDTSNSQEVLKKLLNSIEYKLSRRKIAITELSKIIEDNYYKFYETLNIPSSCDASNNNSFCIVKRERRNLVKVPTLEIRNLIQENEKKYEFIKGQYIGTEEGVVIISAPKIIWPKTNDHRYQSWYSQATNPIKKDIVVIFDNSEKTTDTVQNRKIQSYIEEALETLTNTLNAEDRLALVAMSSSPLNPFIHDKTCPTNKLLFVRPNNKRIFHKFIHQLTPQGTSNYIDAFNTSFSLYSSSPLNTPLNKEPRERLIIFITYSTPKSDISTVQQSIQNSINSPIFTYAIGNNMNNETLEFLKDISTNSFKHNTNFKQKGFFKLVKDVDKLEYEVATYYKSLKDSNKNKDVFVTSPFYDKYAGVLASFCKPIWIFGFLGVARIDVNIKDIFSDIEFFLGGESLYLFLTESTNRALLHQLFPKFFHTFDTVTYLPFNLFEPQLESHQIDQMISSKEGSFAAVTQRIKSPGNSIYEGVDVEYVQSKYYWKRTKEFGFMICFVATENDYLTENEFRLSNYYQLDYHRIAIGCRYKDKIIARNSTTTKFGPELFLKPNQYLSSNESSRNLISYHVFMAQKWVYLSHFLAMNWPENSHQHNNLGTRKQCSIRVNTLSHVVYEGRQNGNHMSQDNVLGVMGLEIRVGYFYYTMEKFILNCQLSSYSCIMIDDTGLMLSYKQAGQNANDTYLYKHITSVEPRLSTELILKKILQRGQCLNTINLKNQIYWKVIIDSEKNEEKSFATYCSICKVNMSTCLENMECQCPCFILKEFNSCQLGQRENITFCSVPLMKQFSILSKASVGLCGKNPSCLTKSPKWGYKEAFRQTGCYKPNQCVKFIKNNAISSGDIAPILGGILGTFGGITVIGFCLFGILTLKKTNMCRKAESSVNDNQETRSIEFTTIENTTEDAGDKSEQRSKSPKSFDQSEDLPTYDDAITSKYSVA